VRKIAPARPVVCANPSYLAQHGTPQHPNDLRDQACLTYGHLLRQPRDRTLRDRQSDG
jgi:DNA-binding transcriptional LysR family regulator